MMFTIGNVVKLHGERSLVIITDVGRKVNNIELVDWVSFEYSNSSGCTRMISYEEKEDCDCSIEFGTIDSECEVCKGNGFYIKEYPGMDKSTVLSGSVKSYIINRLLENFDF